MNLASHRIQILTAIFLLAFPAAHSPVVAADTATERADRIFLNQLTERGFFNLAEQHCQRLMKQATTPYEIGRWQIRLCETYEKHAWSAEAASRNGLLSRSVEELTEFLQTSVAYPEVDLQARLQLVSALRQSVRMSLIISEAGHLFARSRKTVPAWSPDQRTAQLETVKRGVQLTSELLDHLDRIRGDIDSGLARYLRDQARLALAELALLRWRLELGDPIAEQQFQEAEAAIAQSQRTARSPELKHAASWLYAELSLYAGDDETFQLRIRGLQDIKTSADFLLPEFLTIRSLLFDQDATKAARAVDAVATGSALQVQQLAWLKLEALLGVRELAGQLSDDALIASVTSQFEKQRDSIRHSSVGVFRDAAEATARRFDLVNEVGAEVAGLIEQIEYDRAAGRSDDALRLIGVTLQRLPVGSRGRARGSLQLRAGEILIEKKQWSTAVQRLQLAVIQFAEAEMPSEEAASDLLRIFSMAQLVKATDQSARISEQEYISALQNHLQRYAGETTAERAAEWYRRIVAGRNPLKAAELSLSQVSAADNSRHKLKELSAAGDLIRLTSSDPASEDRRKVAEEFCELVSKLTTDRSVYPESDTARVELDALQFQLQNAGGLHDDWPDLRRQFELIGGHLKTSKSKDVPLQLMVLDAVIAARSSSTPNRLSSQTARLNALPAGQLKPTINLLFSQLQNSKPQGGDGWIAEMVDRLVKRTLDQPDFDLKISDMIRLLSTAGQVERVVGQTGNTDRLLSLLLNKSLSDDQLDQIASALMAGSGESSSTNRNNPRATRSVDTFWRKIISLKPQGSDMWLEASLQLAVSAATAGDAAAARKQLGVVQTIYPDWGSPERQRRASRLLTQLSSER